MSTSSLQSSIDYWNRKSFNEYKEYLEKSVKLKDSKDEAKAYIAELTQLVVDKYPKLTEEEMNCFGEDFIKSI